MLQLLSLLSLLPLAFAAPALNTPDVAILKPIQISKFNFNPISFTFNDRNTKIKTTCSSTIIPTAFTSCQNPNISFKFAQGDKANDFHISLKESYTSQETYNVILATKEVTKSPKKFNVPIQNIYPFQPFSLPEIYTFSPSGRPGSSPYATLNATVTDVNVDGKPTTKCTTQWIFGEQPPSGDIPCADPSFILHITEFKGIGQFTLTLNHTYPLKTGTKISTSGSLTLDNQATDRNFVCTYGASGVGSCAIAEGKAPLEAPIDSVTGL
ncbi:MAG: hypothetical protein L6R41_003875 [Letrouitia leprolyta]|nr:MAG: hypothetical protein L6R41_003875 [Letrouitia leprolyta]